MMHEYGLGCLGVVIVNWPVEAYEDSRKSLNPYPSVDDLVYGLWEVIALGKYAENKFEKIIEKVMGEGELIRAEICCGQ